MKAFYTAPMGHQLGIDLGTTFTAAAMAEGGSVRMVNFQSGRYTIPSVVFYSPEGEWFFGDNAERRALADPTRVEREFKRRFGDSQKRIIGKRAPGEEIGEFSVDEITTHLLGYVLDTCKERAGSEPDHVCLTHPADWDIHRKGLLRTVARENGLAPRLLMLSEPEAAAVQYVAEKGLEPGQILAVYDLGGGTFDVAILQRRSGSDVASSEDGPFTFLGDTGEGISTLGGCDFDDLIFHWVLDQLGDAAAELDDEDPEVLAGLSELRQRCVEAKIDLSSAATTPIPVRLPGIHESRTLSKGEFERMIGGKVERTILSMRRAMEAAGLRDSDLSGILLVGGSSRIPVIAEMVRKEFGRQPDVDTDPKIAVAMGAARWAMDAVAKKPAPSRPTPVVETRQDPQKAYEPAPVPRAPHEVQPRDVWEWPGADDEGPVSVYAPTKQDTPEDQDPMEGIATVACPKCQQQNMLAAEADTFTCRVCQSYMARWDCPCGQTWWTPFQSEELGGVRCHSCRRTHRVIKKVAGTSHLCPCPKCQQVNVIESSWIGFTCHTCRTSSYLWRHQDCGASGMIVSRPVFFGTARFTCPTCDVAIQVPTKTLRAGKVLLPNMLNGNFLPGYDPDRPESRVLVLQNRLSLLSSMSTLPPPPSPW